MKRVKPSDRNHIRRWLLIAATLTQAGCATARLEEFRTVEVYGSSSNESSIVAGVPLRSGQVIVREAVSSMGLLMNLMTADHAPFGHAGIVIVEPEGVFVYDAFGILDPRFWLPPTRRLRGRIRRLPLATFIERGAVSAIYEHAHLDMDKVASYAVDAHSARLAFDGMFDYRTPDQVYCNEFVAAALHSGGEINIAPTRRTSNPSLNRVMEWLELDSPGFILSDDLVAGATRVSTIAPRLSAAQIEAHFAYERELHRRFKTDQKLGNLFHWTWRGPQIRPHLIKLHDRLINGADEAPNPADWIAETIELSIHRASPQLASQ